MSRATRISAAVDRSLLVAVALIAGFFSLLGQAVPSGSLICLEESGKLVLEWEGAHCCAALGSTSGHDALAPDACGNCTDCLLTREQADQVRIPVVVVPQPVGDLQVVALIAWPAQ